MNHSINRLIMDPAAAIQLLTVHPAEASFAPAKQLVIPNLPEGIADPNDLLNDDPNPGKVDIKWVSRELHATIQWLKLFVPFQEVVWGHVNLPGAGPGGRAHRSGTFVLVEFLSNRERMTVDVRNIMRSPQHLLAAMYFAAFGQDFPGTLPMYPGADVLYPTKANPVGEAWPSHTHNAANRVIFRVSDSFTSTEYPYKVAPDEPTTYVDGKGRYTLGFAFQEGRWQYFWALDYQGTVVQEGEESGINNQSEPGNDGDNQG